MQHCTGDTLTDTQISCKLQHNNGFLHVRAYLLWVTPHSMELESQIKVTIKSNCAVTHAKGGLYPRFPAGQFKNLF